MAKEPKKIDLYEDVLMGAVRKIRQTFRVAMPGMVEAFNRETSRIQAVIGSKILTTKRTVVDEPPVADLPMILPRGGGYGLHFDVRAGDPTFMICCDGPVRGFFETGEPVIPQNPLGHQFGVAVAFPGGRVSNSTPTQETPPPNAVGTCWMGAEDGSSTVKFSGAALPTPAELGSMSLCTANPINSLHLGSDESTLGVARLTDKVGPSPDMIAFISAIAAFANGLVPGTVPPNVLLALIGPVPPGQIGIITSASMKVTCDD